MSIDNHNPAEIEKRLWAEIDGARVGMVGIVDGRPQHFQPMTAFAVPEAREIWFITRAETDLAREASYGARQAMFILQSKDGECQGCVGGELTVEMDRGRIEQWWSPMLAAFQPDGKDDPDLRLLRLECHDAQVWISDAGPVTFRWRAANATGREPGPGGRAAVTLN